MRALSRQQQRLTLLLLVHALPRVGPITLTPAGALCCVQLCLLCMVLAGAVLPKSFTVSFFMSR